MEDNLANRRCAYGDLHAHAKLTVEIVKTIRASNQSDPALASQYGVARESIRDARNGKTWAHVE